MYLCCFITAVREATSTHGKHVHVNSQLKLLCGVNIGLNMMMNAARKSAVFFLRQWRIQDFPEEGALIPKGGGANLLFGQFFPKTAWKWRNFGPEGGGAHASLAPPLRSATVRCAIFSASWYYWCGNVVNEQEVDAPITNKGKKKQGRSSK